MSGQRTASGDVTSQRSGLVGGGQRREMSLLVPLSLLLLILLAAFTLFAYRSAIELLIDERQQEAVAAARSVASALPDRGVLDGPALARLMTRPGRAALFDSAGRLHAISDSSPAGTPDAAVGEAFDGSSIAGIVRATRRDRRWTVQVDLPAPVLRSRQRSLRVLTPLVLLSSSAILLLALLFMRRRFMPIDRLLSRARDVTGASPDQDVSSLISMFEDTLDRLTQPVDELKAVETTLARSLDSGVLVTDSQGTVLGLNQAGATMLQLPAVAGEQIRRPLEEVLEHQPQLLALLRARLDEDRSLQRVECPIDGADGPRTIGLTAHPLRADGGEVHGLLALFADITDVQRVDAEQRLSESLSHLGELTAGVAHEMRNSLATLRGYLTLAERDPDPAALRDFLSEMQRESHHLQRVLDDFLAFARPGRSRLEMVDLVALSHRAAADPALEGAAVDVIAESAVEIRGDRQLLERAMRNLLLNAVQSHAEAERPDAPLRILVERLPETGQASLVVEDQGTGVDAQMRERLFKPFATGRTDGVGLGLALTRRIVLLHQGSIRLVDGQEHGARAEIVLPLSQPVSIVTKGSYVPTVGSASISPTQT